MNTLLGEVGKLWRDDFSVHYQIVLHPLISRLILKNSYVERCAVRTVQSRAQI